MTDKTRVGRFKFSSEMLHGEWQTLQYLNGWNEYCEWLLMSLTDQDVYDLKHCCESMIRNIEDRNRKWIKAGMK